MNQKNLDFLKDSLKYLGFGEKLHTELENKIKEQPKEFQLTMQGEFKKADAVERVDYKLDFRKSDTTDMFFFNRYHATLKNENPALDKAQTFYITKNAGVTAKEAYNLLGGRAVNKDLVNTEGEDYKAWIQLDFKEKDKNDNFKVKQYHSGYGYELQAVLGKYPIKEMGTEEDRTKLIKSMEKGNLHQVTFVRDGREEKMHIEANPQFKTLNLYDGNFQKIFQGVEKKETQEQGKGKDKKETQKEEVDEDGERKKGKKSSRRKGVGV